ncbi:MAG: ABC transporter ATP-binding protein/permease [Clostridia bacterium]|nr:ABC transporter ATP-binding protein/permease [Clostridia bacterium]
MIKLIGIKKVYKFDDRKTDALKGVSVEFRDSEFVCVLGPSGCGKTTLLNIIGGLDRYDDGNLFIGGKSTKDFSDEDWDTYRSRLVGFVFQSYNLIPHQTVIENVETALTISGVSGEERRKRAIAALVRVGLEEHLRKKPSQLSGGEMQRVAIARAIVNDPKMILADEPTGALDSKNSVLIMDLLKEISRDRLVVTVTHNDELAARYATRTIKMRDGQVVSDSAPYAGQNEVNDKSAGNVSAGDKPGVNDKPGVDDKSVGKPKKKAEEKKSFMSYALAAKLSLKNLAGKKVRTIFTSVAAAISVLGIALVVACTNGLNSFVNKVQKDAMSAIPITVSNSAVFDSSGIIDSFMSGYFSDKDGAFDYEKKAISIKATLKDTFARADASKTPVTEEYVNYVRDNIDSSRATYSLEKRVKKNVFKTINVPIYSNPPLKGPINVFVPTASNWTCLPEDSKKVEEQYEILAGSYPAKSNELMLVTDKNGRITDTNLLAYFIDVYAAIYDSVSGADNIEYSYDKILNSEIGKFYLVLNDDLYVKNANETFSAREISLEKYINKLDYVFNGKNVDKKWTNSAAGNGTHGNIVLTKLKKQLGTKAVAGFSQIVGCDINEMKCYDENPYDEDFRVDTTNGYELKITCIAKLKDDTQCGMLYSPLCYTQALNDYIIEDSASSEVVAAQKNNKTSSVVAGAEFKNYTAALENLGYAELPTKIYFYPNTLGDKDYLLSVLDAYNEGKAESEKTYYVDNVGAVMGVVRMIVDGVVSVLVVLTSVSLIVSAIMIGIITYVSVIERTKEIGVLRAVGARKKDVVRLFVTETGMIGAIAGAMGLAATFIAEIPLNAVMKSITGVGSLVVLSPLHVLAILIGSVIVTIAAGLIPSLFASKKDPVKALRSE